MKKFLFSLLVACFATCFASKSSAATVEPAAMDVVSLNVAPATAEASDDRVVIILEDGTVIIIDNDKIIIVP